MKSILEKCKAIIYDFDGVILDSVDTKTKAFAKLYEHAGEDIQKKVVDYHLLHGGVSRFEKFKYYERAFFNREISESETQEMASKFSDLVFNEVLNSNYIEGIEEFLTTYAVSKLQFVCTGTPEEEILSIIEKKNLTQFFNGIYGSPRKKTEIINIILAKYSLKPDEVLFIGDAMTDYNAAKETRCHFLGVTDRSGNTTLPSDAILITDFNEIKYIPDNI